MTVPALWDPGFRMAPPTRKWSVTICTYIGISGMSLENTFIGIEAHCEDKAVEIAIEMLKKQGHRTFECIGDVHEMRAPDRISVSEPKEER